MATGRRPSTSRAELERVALDLFTSRGFEETTVDDVAAAAGIGRRTFFRYYASKNDLVWGDFAGELARLRAWFAAVPAGAPLMESIRRAVVEFNRYPPEQGPRHRERMALILNVPSLLANSTLKFVQWRGVIADFVADRLELAADELFPTVIGHCALGASIAAYEAWLRDESADLTEVLDAALEVLTSDFTPPAGARSRAGSRGPRR